MKIVVSLIIVGASVWTGSNLSAPVFDAAAREVCSPYAEDQGWELVEYSGRLGHRRQRHWFTPKSPNYSCTFEDIAGETVIVDELDDVMPVTWEARGLRLAGWALMAGPAVAAVVVAGVTGLLKRE